MPATTWRIDEEAHARFVQLSGDANPLHADPVASRRMPFGQVAVHGMHLVLDALERLVTASPGAPRRVRGTFRHQIGVNEEIGTAIEYGEPQTALVQITTGAWVAAELVVELGEVAAPFTPPQLEPPRHGPAEIHGIASLAGRQGSLAVQLDSAVAAGRFPALCARMGIGPLGELVTLTRLVGMHVPGLHSLFSSFDVTIDLARPSGHTLHYAVGDADDRFSRVVLDVVGPTLRGQVTAFVRARPVEPALGCTLPVHGEFAGQRWLVVGGSRGLGALAVLLADAGKAEVRFTYRLGREDAVGLAARSAGALPFPLTAGGGQQLDAVLDGWAPTHLAFMATPPIAVGRHGAYSDALRDRFRKVYVDDFLATVDQIGAGRLHGVLWPSSAAVDGPVPGMAEYADAKREGEAACARLAQAHPHLIVATPRWPRLLTDQTTSFVPTEYGDGPAEVLAALRAAAGATAGPYTPTPCPKETR